MGAAIHHDLQIKRQNVFYVLVLRDQMAKLQRPLFRGSWKQSLGKHTVPSCGGIEDMIKILFLRSFSSLHSVQGATLRSQSHSQSAVGVFVSNNTVKGDASGGKMK